MKQGRGCGCLVLILGMLNLLVALSVIYGIIAVENTAVPTSLLMVGLFAGNVAACLMLARSTLRRETFTSPGDSEGDSGVDDQGEDGAEENP